jgi:hypothetical protein
VGLVETLAELIIAEELKRGGELTISRTDPFLPFLGVKSFEATGSLPDS